MHNAGNDVSEASLMLLDVIMAFSRRKCPIAPGAHPISVLYNMSAHLRGSPRIDLSYIDALYCI